MLQFTLVEIKDPSETPILKPRIGGINNQCAELASHRAQPAAHKMQAAVNAVSAARRHGTLGTAFAHLADNHEGKAWQAVGVVVAENAPVVARVRAALVECNFRGDGEPLPAALLGTTDVEAKWTFHLLYLMVYGLAHDYL